MVDIQNFIVAHWGLMLAWLAVGTALTRVLDAVAKALPQYPRLTHFAQIVDELVVDVVDVVTAIGKMFSGTATAASLAAKTTLVALTLLIGCSLFGTPTGKVVECSAAAMANVLSELCPEPATPFCVAIAQIAYEEACQAAANAGADQEHAHKAGLDAAKGSLDKLKARGVKLDATSASP